MAIDAGSIEYTVKTDTSSQLKADKIVDQSTRNIEKSFQRVDKVAAKTTKNATKNFGIMGRASGQAGIQLQQFIGQVQGGQNAMLALSQQSADLGFVLGAPLLGAVVGISASIAGLLAPSLLASKDNTELLEKALELLKETTAETSDGTIVLSESLELLAKKSKAAAAVEIALGMERAKNVIKLARIEIDELASSFESFFTKNSSGLDASIAQLKTLEEVSLRTNETQVEVIERLGDSYEGSLAGIGGVSNAVNKLSKEYKISTAESLAFIRALAQFKKDKTSDSFETLSTVISAIATGSKTVNKEFLEMAKGINDASTNALDAAETISLFTDATKDLDAALVKSSESGFKKQKQAADDLSDALDRMFAVEERLDEARARREAADKARLAKRVAATGITPLQALIARQDIEVEILKQGLEKKIIAEQEFLDRSAQLNIQHQEQVMALNKKTTDESAVNWGALENQIIGTMTSIVTGAQSGKEAMAGLARTVLTQMVGALIKMGIQALIGQTTAAAAGVATAATLATAYATPAALVSLASFGANGPPAAAAITGTVALSQGLALSGSREHGGPVSAGKSFLVGERGKEIFTPNQSGRITSNSDSFGGGNFEQTVIIENNTQANVSTKTSDDGKQMRIFINEVANQISSNQGPIPKAMRQSTNTTFRTSR